MGALQKWRRSCWRCGTSVSCNFGEFSERPDIALQKVVNEAVQGNTLAGGLFHQKRLNVLLQLYGDVERGIGSGKMPSPLGAAEIVFRFKRHRRSVATLDAG